MKRNKSIPIPDSPPLQAMEYLKNVIFKMIQGDCVEKALMSPLLSVGIGLGCPEHPLTVCIQSHALDRYAAEALNSIGIPDALDSIDSSKNSDAQYLSISWRSLMNYGAANKDKILNWVASRNAGTTA